MSIITRKILRKTLRDRVYALYGFTLYERVQIVAKIGTSDEESCAVSGFRVINVFDLAQMEGNDDELPLVVAVLKADIDYSSLLVKISEGIDIPISFDDMSYAQHSKYAIKENHILIISRNTPLHSLKTLFHELTHHFHLDTCKGKRNRLSMDMEKFVMESSA